MGTVPGASLILGCRGKGLDPGRAPPSAPQAAAAQRSRSKRSTTGQAPPCIPHPSLFPSLFPSLCPSLCPSRCPSRFLFSCPLQVDVLVSEPMGTLLVNERMIESYIFARDRHLKPGGKMFPVGMRGTLGLLRWGMLGLLRCGLLRLLRRLGPTEGGLQSGCRELGSWGAGCAGSSPAMRKGG